LMAIRRPQTSRNIMLGRGRAAACAVRRLRKGAGHGAAAAEWQVVRQTERQQASNLVFVANARSALVLDAGLGRSRTSRTPTRYAHPKGGVGRKHGSIRQHGTRRSVRPKRSLDDRLSRTDADCPIPFVGSEGRRRTDRRLGCAMGALPGAQNVHAEVRSPPGRRSVCQRTRVTPSRLATASSSSIPAAAMRGTGAPLLRSSLR